jgi:hypothetical protein
MIQVSKMDEDHLKMIRNNVKSFIKEISENFDAKDTILLDVAPQDYLGAKEFFVNTKIETLDIDPDAGADYIADICNNNTGIIPDNYFNYVLLTEVLEHTLNPFDAIKEIERILIMDGLLFITVPFNFRIHGPLPDCWRFTEHGIKALLGNFEIIKIEALETPQRELMPIQYKIIARKIKGRKNR